MNGTPNRRLYVRFALLFVALAARVFAQQDVADWQKSKRLYRGVQYLEISVTEPRDMDVFCVRIDTKARGIDFYTTPPCEGWVENVFETRRQTTRDFIRESRKAGINVVVAVNTDAFSPWPAPWDEETLTNLAGLAVSEGRLVSPAGGSASLLIDRRGRPRMELTDGSTDLAGVETAVSGFAFCLLEGRPLAGNEDLHPRTGLGLSKDARYLYFMAIDGRRHASQGATTEEVGRWLRYFGAHTGINMDGGGSTTLAWWDRRKKGADKAVLFNRPVGDGRNWLRLPREQEQAEYAPSERRNGASLGVVLKESLIR